MKNKLEIFSALPLFKGMTDSEIEKLLLKSRLREKKISAGQTVIMQGESYDELILLISGSCTGSMIDLSGKEIIVEQFNAPSLIAAGILFSSHTLLPVSINAVTNVEICILPKKEIVQLCSQYPAFLLNFLGLISDKVSFLSKRLSFMSFKSIKAKTAHYILSLPVSNGVIVLPQTIEELSTYFGVARPSLSRVFQQLEEEKIIVKNNREIRILNKSKLIEIDE